ncbi:general substrate transporter [Penicillium argentinense]|uniref:General substrate transporter n=1 Tax=Penicillium argentinense TaxID=1131581 RepID=A0A9W9FH44_9EURO|nr:general substrate transporter [Penicillium argentinense]KAJ5100118.1 general substrate transporter [Penicillium argentinense]
MLFKRPQNEKGAAWPAILVGLFASFGGILYGYDTGTIAGIQTMPYWLDEFNHPNEGRISLIVSILSVGTFVGALAAGIIADITGRKWGIIISVMLPFNLGVALQTAATAQPLFIAGRFFAGLGVGLVSAQVPMYQSETLPKWIRGAVVGCYQFCITIGLFLAAIVNWATQHRNDSGSYRIPLAIQFAWAIILAGGLVFLPETPRFLIKKGDEARALKSLVFLRRLNPDDPDIISELAELKSNWEYEQSLGSASYIECFKGTTGKRTITGIILQSLQQLVGINFIIYYGTSYFAENVEGLPDSFILQVIVNCVNVVMTLPGLWAIDHFGRRPVLLIGALGMGISQYIVSACGAATPISNFTSQCAQFAFICIYVSFFASTFGPCAWVVTGEIFSLQTRAKGLSMTTAANWFFNWLLSFITPYLTGALNPTQSNVFWIWGSFCWIAFVFVYTMIYETKGLALEQVNELYENESRAWKSPGYRSELRTLSVSEVHDKRLANEDTKHSELALEDVEKA